MYAADYAVPTPAYMTTAIGDMEAAYTDASQRAVSGPTYVNRFQGMLTGKTFGRGVYSWDRDVSFSGDIYITGRPSDVVIFKTTGNVVAGPGASVILAGGIKPENIVWQMAGFLEANTGAHLEGIFLVKTKAVFKTGSGLNGRVLAQTAVTLDQSSIIAP
jgi:hypothetical protein